MIIEKWNRIVYYLTKNAIKGTILILTIALLLGIIFR